MKRKKKTSVFQVLLVLVLLAVCAAVMIQVIPDILNMTEGKNGGGMNLSEQTVEEPQTAAESEATNTDSATTIEAEGETLQSEEPAETNEPETEVKTGETEPENETTEEIKDTFATEPEFEPEENVNLGMLGIEGIDVVGIYPSENANLDGDGSYSLNLATLEIRNNSEKHITAADITVTTNKGKQLKFRLEQIPFGYTVKAFDLNGSEITEEEEIESISWTPVFARYTRLVANKMKYTLNGTCMTVKSIESVYIYNIDLYFHAVENGTADILLGGKTYIESIVSLWPGQTVEFYISHCNTDNAVLTYVYPGYDGNEAE